jgi:hypothetical protein
MKDFVPLSLQYSVHFSSIIAGGVIKTWRSNETPTSLNCLQIFFRFSLYFTTGTLRESATQASSEVVTSEEYSSCYDTSFRVIVIL